MKILLTLSLFVTALSGAAQSDYGPRLSAKFSEECIRELQRDQPQTIGYLTSCLNEGFTVMSSADGKVQTSEKTLRIKDFEALTITIFSEHMRRR